MRTIFLDIETGPAPEKEREFFKPTEEKLKLGNTKDPAKIKGKLFEAIEAWEDRCALSPFTAQVIMVGWAIDDGEFQCETILDMSEKELIANLQTMGRTSDEKPVPLAIGTRKDFPELAVILDKALASLSPQTIQDIHRKWTKSADPMAKAIVTR